MSNERAVIEALCAMPFTGAVFDFEPYPVGEVIFVQPVELSAVKVGMRIWDRHDPDRVADRTSMVIYAGSGDERVAVAFAMLEEDEDGEP